jgi:hypothetical protein
MATVPVQGAAALRTAWGFVMEYGFGDLQVRLRLDPRVPAAAAAMTRRALAPLQAVEIQNDRPDLLLVPASQGRLLLRAAGGAALGPAIDPANAASELELRRLVLAYSRSLILHRIELRDPRIRVEFAVLRTRPRTYKQGGETLCRDAPPQVLSETAAGPEGLQFSPGDEYTLRFQNTGPDPAYLTVLSLGPSGTVAQLYPAAGAHGSDNYLPPGRTYLITDTCFFAEPPFGVEVLKLFATRERLDFHPMLSESVAAFERSGMSPLTRLFADASVGQRSGPLTTATGWGSSAALSLTIVPRGRQTP